MPDFIPRADSELLTWSANLSQKVLADPQSYGISEELAQDLSEKQAAYAAAYRLVVSPSTKCPTNFVAKRAARAALEDVARRVNKITQGSGTSKPLRVTLGLKTREKGVRQLAIPEQMPGLRIVKLIGHELHVRVYDKYVARKGKPPLAHGAAFFYHVGENPPQSFQKWQFGGMTSGLKHTLSLRGDLFPGQVIHVVACWTSSRAQQGPICPPVQTYVQFGGSMMMKQLKVAA